MADTKISALASASTPLAGTEVLPIVQSGATVKVPVSSLTAGRDVSTANLSTTGNVAVNVTPSAWSVGNYVEVGLPGNAIWSPGSIFVTQNTYYNSGYKYASNAAASYYQQNVGIHYWYTAPAGTTGNPVTFTQAMTLDNSKIGRAHV